MPCTRWADAASSRKLAGFLVLSLTLLMSFSRIYRGQISPSGETTTAVGLVVLLNFPQLQHNKWMWGAFIFGTYVKNLVSHAAFLQMLLTGQTFWHVPELMKLDELDKLLPTVTRMCASPMVFMLLAYKLGFQLQLVLRTGLFLGLTSVVSLGALAHLMAGANGGMDLVILSVCWATWPIVMMAWILYDNESHLKTKVALLQRVAESKQRELEQQNIAAHNQQRIVRYIFHEVRNPVNNIMLAAELLLAKIAEVITNPVHHHNKPPPPRSNSASLHMDSTLFRQPSTPNQESALDEIQDLTNDVYQSTQAAMRVLNDALNLQRLQSGAFEFVHKPFSVQHLVSSTLRMVNPRLQAKGVKVHATVSDELKTITVGGDFYRLQQVLLNYLTNASKFTPDNGSVTVCADVVLQSEPQTEPEASDSNPQDHKDRKDRKFIVWSKRESAESNGLDESKMIRFSVCNTGQGISDQDKDKIFKPWSQIRAGEKEQDQGSGLGLALCKAFVETGHNGRIWFTSEYGKATTFFFEIPLHVCGVLTEEAQSKLNEAEKSQRKAPDVDSDTNSNSKNSHNHNHNHNHNNSHDNDNGNDDDGNDNSSNGNNSHQTSSVCHSHKGSGGSGRVLIVEDSAVCRKLVGKTLKQLGVPFEQCVDGQEAVEYVAKVGLDYFELILMDKEMPRLDGFEATRTLRALGYAGAIVGCTGNAMDDQVADFLRAGANQVLGKPITHDALHTVIHDVSLAHSFARPLLQKTMSESAIHIVSTHKKE